MKKLLILFFLQAGFFNQPLWSQTKTDIKNYIEKYRQVAIDEMIRTGVPASITLAQGIHETSAGTSDLVLRSNNHFGIKCKTEWTGEKVYHDDDARGECFRKYTDPSISYRDHSDFLRTRSHYSSLFNLDPTDYEAWAIGLKKAGYATNPKYPQILIKIIRDYQLQDYSLIALGRKVNDLQPGFAKSVPARDAAIETIAPVVYPQGIFTINDTKVIYVEKGISYLKLAEDYDISISRLLDFNDLKNGDVTTNRGLIYLQRKRKTGANNTHKVLPGETLYDIAQAEGLRLESLLEYNYLTPGVQVASGEELYLTAQAPNMPRLADEKVYQEKIVHTATIEQPPATHQTAVVNDAFVMHIVQPKETMYSIAKRYGVGMDEVKKWNNFETTDLKIGQQIKIIKTR